MTAKHNCASTPDPLGGPEEVAAFARAEWEATTSPLVLDAAMFERGGVALVNADALEPYDREDGRWRPAVLAEAVIREALKGADGWVPRKRSR